MRILEDNARRRMGRRMMGCLVACGALAITSAAQSLREARVRAQRSTPGVILNVDTGWTFPTIQAAIDDPTTLAGHTITVGAGNYPEEVFLLKELNLFGAQAGASASGRVTGAPNPLVESIIAPPSGDALMLFTQSISSVIDGFVFLGGTNGISTSSGPIDQLQLLNNHFEGQTASNVFLNDGGGDLTIDGNVFRSTASMGTSFHFGANDFDGLFFTGNELIRTGGATARGLLVNGFNNVGPSVARMPRIAQNVVTGHNIGMDMGTRAFAGGEFLQNDFRSNGTGLGFGIQNSMITSNLFAGNDRGLHLDSLGSMDPTRGAFGNTIVGNQFLASSSSGIELSAGQVPGSISTNTFDMNCFVGNALAVAYAGSETVSMENHWWGDPSGPFDPVGSNPASTSFCPPVPLINAGGMGDELTGDNVDYCPWLAMPAGQSMAVSAADCQDDAFPGEAGLQVEFELGMSDLGTAPSGFQAFLTYDSFVLSYRGDLSSYSSSPFALHIQDVLTAEFVPGELRLDGSTSFGGTRSTADALLATLVFDVDLECSNTSVDFDLGQPFPSALSFAGFALPTSLANSPDITLDDTLPVFDPISDVTVASDASSPGGCGGAIVSYPMPTVVDNCGGILTIACIPPAGSLFPIGTTVVTCTATDVCGNVGVSTFDITVTPTNLMDVEVDLIGVTGSATRCIRFVMDDCSTTVDALLSFVPGAPAKATATIEIPCGDYALLNAKDEQHTLWGSTPLTLSIDGTRYETTASVLLEGGDTDNDGDVDINDVTWFLGQFGMLAAAGGCPYDGVTRDADFSVNGAVGSEDYVFLSANWLATSSCNLTLVLTERDRPRSVIEVTDARTRHADLDRNGRIDYRDVRLFEERHGLPHDLSNRMHRETSR